MTNREKFEEKLIEIREIAVTKEKQELVVCRRIPCKDCLFYYGNCDKNYQRWLTEEYIEHKEKKQPTERDIEIMAACKEILDFSYFAKDKDGTVYGYQGSPFKQEDKWGCLDKCYDLNVSLSHLSWEDEEPYYFEGK